MSLSGPVEVLIFPVRPQRPSSCRAETEWLVRDYTQINQRITVTLHHIGAECDSDSECFGYNLKRAACAGPEHQMHYWIVGSEISLAFFHFIYLFWQQAGAQNVAFMIPQIFIYLFYIFYFHR